MFFFNTYVVYVLLLQVDSQFLDEESFKYVDVITTSETYFDSWSNIGYVDNI